MFMYYNNTFVIKYCTYHKISEIKNKKYFSMALKFFNKTARTRLLKTKLSILNFLPNFNLLL